MKRLLFIACILFGCTTQVQTPVPIPTPIPVPVPIPVPPVGVAPVITAQPSSYTVDAGKYIYIWSMLADVTGVTFQWFKNDQPFDGGGINITADGSTQYEIWIPASAATDAGTYYATYTNAFGTTKSDVITIVVNPPIQPVPIPPITPVTGTLLVSCGSCDGGPQGIINTDDLAKFMNKPVDLVLIWGWAADQGQQEYWATNRSEMWPAKYKILWDMPMIIHGTTFADCYNGKYDSSYKIVATTISARDPAAILRFGHEMNGNWYDWSMDGPAGTAAEYAQCYQHIVGVFRAISPKFLFDWNPGLGMWAGLDGVRTYPGDAFVDFVSLDMYEDSQWFKGTPDERWQYFLDGDGRGLTYWAKFVKDHNKQLGFDEWASNIDDGSLIGHMAQWMKDNPTHHQMYWDSDAAFKGSFASNPNNGKAFQQLFGAPVVGLFATKAKIKALKPSTIVGARAHKWTKWGKKK